jgi:cytochrome c5
MAGRALMKVFVITVFAVLLFVCSLKLFALPQTSAQGAKAAKAVPEKKRDDAKEGERRFQENCGRCHNPPDSISPREVKAVLQHMRVRAMLSAEDERLILKYLAP